MNLDMYTPSMPKGKGFFAIIEGIDGSGKTTAIMKLEKLLNEKISVATGEKGPFVVMTRQPGGTPFAEELRNLFFRHVKDIDQMTQAFLMAASRREIVEKLIKPSLEAGLIVLCDRFTLSTHLYQSEIPTDDHLVLESYTCADCIPDVALVFHVTPENAMARTSGRLGNNALDSQQATVIQQRAENMLALMSDIEAGELPLAHNVVSVDGNQPLDVVDTHLDSFADQVVKMVVDYRKETWNTSE